MSLWRRNILRERITRCKHCIALLLGILLGVLSLLTISKRRVRLARLRLIHAEEVRIRLHLIDASNILAMLQGIPCQIQIVWRVEPRRNTLRREVWKHAKQICLRRNRSPHHSQERRLVKLIGSCLPIVL